MTLVNEVNMHLDVCTAVTKIIIKVVDGMLKNRTKQVLILMILYIYLFVHFYKSDIHLLRFSVTYYSVIMLVITAECFSSFYYRC